MPIYEFHCEKCGKDSEILVRSSDWKDTKCPQCGSAKLEKKFSTFSKKKKKKKYHSKRSKTQSFDFEHILSTKID